MPLNREQVSGDRGSTVLVVVADLGLIRHEQEERGSIDRSGCVCLLRPGCAIDRQRGLQRNGKVAGYTGIVTSSATT